VVRSFFVSCHSAAGGCVGLKMVRRRLAAVKIETVLDINAAEAGNVNSLGTFFILPIILSL